MGLSVSVATLLGISLEGAVGISVNIKLSPDEGLSLRPSTRLGAVVGIAAVGSVRDEEGVEVGSRV